MDPGLSFYLLLPVLLSVTVFYHHWWVTPLITNTHNSGVITTVIILIFIFVNPDITIYWLSLLPWLLLAPWWHWYLIFIIPNNLNNNSYNFTTLNECHVSSLRSSPSIPVASLSTPPSAPAAVALSTPCGCFERCQGFEFNRTCLEKMMVFAYGLSINHRDFGWWNMM